MALTVPAGKLADMAPEEATAALLGALQRVLAEPDFRWFLYCIERNNILNFTFSQFVLQPKTNRTRLLQVPYFGRERVAVLSRRLRAHRQPPVIQVPRVMAVAGPGSLRTCNCVFL